MLVAAGFKTISPKTPAQQQKLQQLQTGQAAQIQKNGRTYYVVADPPRNVVYVGGPTEYQAYQQMRAQRQLAQENLQTAEMYQDAAMDLGYMGWLGRRLGTDGLRSRRGTGRRSRAVLKQPGWFLIGLTSRHLTTLNVSLKQQAKQRQTN